MKVLFVNANLHGHINPTLGLVKKLTERGNQISYFCSEPFSEQVTKMGARWIGYSNKLELFLKEYNPTDRHPFYMLMEYMLLYDEIVLPEILNFLEEEQYVFPFLFCYEPYTDTREDACARISFSIGLLLSDNKTNM